MAKDEAYHRAAVKFNEDAEAFFRDLAQKIEHSDVKHWARRAAKNYRLHRIMHEKWVRRLTEHPQIVTDPSQLTPEGAEQMREALRAYEEAEVLSAVPDEITGEAVITSGEPIVVNDQESTEA
jgi:hypothetical protein